MRFRNTCAVGVAVVSIGWAAACSSAPDPSDRVETALKNAAITDVDASYDKTGRVVHLKGTVDSRELRARAEQIAERAVGTSGKVLNEVTVKGVDEKTADDNDGRIKDQLKGLIAADQLLSQRDISFSVNNGAVEVSGSVATPAEKTKVTDVARSVAGVRDVANGLEVKTNK